METLLKDIRYGIRSLSKRPAFTALAVITLALGIGASTAIFSVVDAVLLRSLPYPDAQQIVQLREVIASGGQMAFAELNFVDLRERTRTLETVAQYSGGLTTVTGGAEPVRVTAFSVTDDFFRVLSTQPVVGRTFISDESKRRERVAVVSFGFWQRLLGGKSDLSNTFIKVFDENCVVIGVMPAGFAFPSTAEIWVPHELLARPSTRSAHNWAAIGRMRPGVNIDQARAELGGIGKQLKQEHGKEMDAVEFTAISQQEYMVGNVRGGLLVMLGAVGFLLAVACANVANLLLAQVTARQREFAVRTALGATRTRLARQFITENLLLSLAGGALGILLAFWGIDLLLALNQKSLPRLNEIGVDARAMVFTIGLAMLIAVVLGLVPLFRYSNKKLEATLRGTARGQTNPASQRLRGLLVVGQMALTLVLLVGAGLLGKSFYRLLQIDPGFQAESAVVMQISTPNSSPDKKRIEEFLKAYELLRERGIVPEPKADLTVEQKRQLQFQQQVVELVSQVPGVTAAGSINRLPLTGNASSGHFLINNNPSRTGQAEYRIATGGYFSAMAIPLLRGRTFTAADQLNSPNAAIISQSVATNYWPNEDAIGQTIQFGNMDGDLRLLHVVGIVGDVHADGIDAPPKPTVYANALQRQPSSQLAVVARGAVPPAVLIPGMRQAVKSLNPDLPVEFRTLEQVFASSLDQRRVSVVIFSVFGSVALLLAALGIYGVTSYAVVQRTQEIGIRMALGARMSDVLKLVLRSSMTLTLIGAGIGVAGALALTRLMTTLLFGVTATDVPTFIVVAVALIAVALISCYIPARRATKVDPLVALRYE
jgi:putative ABC transport system permease protein